MNILNKTAVFAAALLSLSLGSCGTITTDDVAPLPTDLEIDITDLPGECDGVLVMEMTIFQSHVAGAIGAPLAATQSGTTMSYVPKKNSVTRADAYKAIDPRSPINVCTEIIIADEACCSAIASALGMSVEEVKKPLYVGPLKAESVGTWEFNDDQLTSDRPTF